MFGEIFEWQAEIFKGLAHPRRLEIVALLRSQELPVTDIHTMLDLPQANISQHLALLRSAHIVQTRREGKQMYYSLVSPIFSQVVEILRSLQIDSTVQVSHLTELVPLVHDPVCGMRVSPKTAGFSQKYQSRMYYFCASGCHKKFEERPAHYV